MTNLFDSLSSDDGSSVDGKTPPPPKVVDWFHGKASTEEPSDIHHRIGTGASDAAPGNHGHRGRDSFPLFDAAEIATLTDLSGTPSSAQIVASVNAINELLRLIGES